MVTTKNSNFYCALQREGKTIYNSLGPVALEKAPSLILASF